MKGLDQNVNDHPWVRCAVQGHLLPSTTFLRKEMTQDLHSLQVPYMLWADKPLADWLFQVALLLSLDTLWRHGKQQNIRSEMTDGAPWYVLDAGKEIGKWLRHDIYPSCKASAKAMLSLRSSLPILQIGLIPDSRRHVWGNPDKIVNILFWVCQLCCRMLGI